MRGLKQTKKSRKFLTNISRPSGERFNFAGSHDHYAYSGGRLILTDRRVSADIQVLDTSSSSTTKRPHSGEPAVLSDSVASPSVSLGPSSTAKRPCLDESEDLANSSASTLDPFPPSCCHYEPTSRSSPVPSAFPLMQQEGGVPAAGTPRKASAATEGAPAGKEAPHTQSRKAKKNAGERLKEWEELFPKILAGMLRIEAHPLIPGGKCQRCHSEPAVTCCYECMDSPGLCQACVVTRHVHHPFHWIQVWNGKYFVPTDLIDLGYVRWLGHQGAQCPERVKGKAPPLRFVVVHTNGVHQCAIQPCACVGCPVQLDQALNAQLFPGTVDLPNTLFTHEVLRDAHVDVLTSKKSPHDYMRKLDRKSESRGKGKKRYHEFNVVFRVWKHLQMVKRAGWCHGVTYPNRRRDSIAVPCFACPWPGVNLPEMWEATEEDIRYIYRIFMGADGNHSLHKKTKRDDKSDYSLSAGCAFFADCDKMASFAKKTSKDRTVLRTCSGFRVTRSQRAGKFRNMDISGVVAITCLRHGCFFPRAVVDLVGNEQFHLVDIAMCGAVECALRLLEWLLSYDVGCTYLANMLSRWEEWDLPPEMRKIVECMKTLLPQMHMLSHKEDCQVDFAMCYKQGNGHTNGETVEIAWAILGETGRSTREMNGGARHDALSDQFGGYNWDKMVNLADYLAQKLSEKLRLQLDQAVDFSGVTFVAGPDLIWDWAKLDLDDQAFTPGNYRERQASRKAAVQSVYILDKSQVPSETKEYDKLIKEATANTDNAVQAARNRKRGKGVQTREGLTQAEIAFIHLGIQVSREQVALRSRVEAFFRSHAGKGVSTDTSRNLRSARATLRDRLTKFRNQQVTYMPHLDDVQDNEEPEALDGDSDDDLSRPIDSDEEDDEGGWEDDDEDLCRLSKQGPERELMGLPSDLGEDAFEGLSCTALGLAELQIRIGLAYDLVTALKEAISRKSATVTSKKKHARGQKDNIAANSSITTVHVEIHRLAAQYNDNFTRMNSLSTRLNSLAVTTAVPKSLKAINVATDLGIFGPTLPKKVSNPGGFHLQDRRTLGDHTAVGSWLFHVAPPNDGSLEAQGQWQREAQRVQWFRSRANLARTNEEVNLVLAEARALRRGFMFASEEWSRRRSATPPQAYSSPGSTAYADEKSDMFRTMSEQCAHVIQSAWEKYHTHAAEDDERAEAYARTQKGKQLSDQCLRYDVSIRSLVLLADEEAHQELAAQGKASRATRDRLARTPGTKC